MFVLLKPRLSEQMQEQSRRSVGEFIMYGTNAETDLNNKTRQAAGFVCCECNDKLYLLII
jgi:hypothetical protein